MATTLLAYAPLLLLLPQGLVPAGAMLAVRILCGAGALFTLIPLIQLRLAHAAPEAGPVLSGLNGSMIFAGQGGGALLGGLAIDLAGFGTVALGGTAMALTGLLLATTIGRRTG